MRVDEIFAAQVQMNELRDAQRSSSVNGITNPSPAIMKRNPSSPSKIFKAYNKSPFR